MEGKCPLCGAEEIEREEFTWGTFACGTWMDCDVPQQSVACCQTQLAAFKALVREMGDEMKLLYDQDYHSGDCGGIGDGCAICRIQAIIDRPEVKAILKEGSDVLS